MAAADAGAAIAEEAQRDLIRRSEQKAQEMRSRLNAWPEAGGRSNGSRDVITSLGVFSHGDLAEGGSVAPAGGALAAARSRNGRPSSASAQRTGGSAQRPVVRPSSAQASRKQRTTAGGAAALARQRQRGSPPRAGNGVLAELDEFDELMHAVCWAHRSRPPGLRAHRPLAALSRPLLLAGGRAPRGGRGALRGPGAAAAAARGRDAPAPRLCSQGGAR